MWGKQWLPYINLLISHIQKLQGLNILLGGKLVLVERWFGQEVGLVLKEKIEAILGEHQDSFGNYF